MEIWRDIEGYEGLYEVSNKGRVKRAGKVLSPNYNPRSGYATVVLCKNGVQKRLYIHRFVAMAFAPNPYKLDCVNHKDENKKNNAADNLEWCTQLYNNHYGRHAPVNARKKTVIQMTITGEILQEYESAKAACKQTGIKRQAIGKCCLGKQKRAGGYKWRFGEGATN